MKAPLGFYTNIKNGYTTLKKAKENQGKFKDDLNLILRGKPKHKSEDQKSTTENRKKLYRGWEKVINLFDDYFIILSEAKYKAEHGEGLKILPLKQMLQILSTALALVKTGKVSENLLNNY